MHPHNGSRFLSLETPILAYQGIVYNPGKKEKTYRAGWHIGLDKTKIEEYLKIFTADRKLCVCKVYVKNIRNKPRSKAPIFLAKEMLIKSKDWDKAIREYL